jgi:hypothetical protein
MKLPQRCQIASDHAASTSSLAKPQCYVSMIKCAERNQNTPKMDQISQARRRLEGRKAGGHERTLPQQTRHPIFVAFSGAWMSFAESLVSQIPVRKRVVSMFNLSTCSGKVTAEPRPLQLVVELASRSLPSEPPRVVRNGSRAICPLTAPSPRATYSPRIMLQEMWNQPRVQSADPVEDLRHPCADHRPKAKGEPSWVVFG